MDRQRFVNSRFKRGGFTRRRVRRPGVSPGRKNEILRGRSTTGTGENLRITQFRTEIESSAGAYGLADPRELGTDYTGPIRSYCEL